MSYLDQIFRRILIDGPVTVDANYNSQSVSVDGIKDEFSINISYNNGVSVDMDVYVQFSNDNINFASDTATLTNITTADGSILYDFSGTGAQFLRIRIEVTSGSIDVIEAGLIGKRNH
jgi:hypothetical protein